jgi:uncharacterized membrane protein YjjB (DUF3815 family)
MTILINILLNACWSGVAALGFGILFNASSKTFFAIWLGGFVAGLVKFSMLLYISPGSVVLASFLAALSVGILSIPVAHWRHTPPVIFSIPSVIPLMPGVFAYKTMLGLMKLVSETDTGYMNILANTFHYGVLTLFVVLSLALGVSIPMHILRADSVKNIRLKKK